MMHTVTSGAGAPTFEEYAASAWPSLYRYAYLLTGNHADAEDIAQQTLSRPTVLVARAGRGLAGGVPAADAHQHLPLAAAPEGATARAAHR